MAPDMMKSTPDAMANRECMPSSARPCSRTLPYYIFGHARCSSEDDRIVYTSTQGIRCRPIRDSSSSGLTHSARLAEDTTWPSEAVCSFDRSWQCAPLQIPAAALARPQARSAEGGQGRSTPTGTRTAAQPCSKDAAGCNRQHSVNAKHLITGMAALTACLCNWALRSGVRHDRLAEG